MLWGLRSANRSRTAVLTSRRGRRRPKGIDLRTTRSLPPEDRDVRDGIPVTSLARTLADCARRFDDEQLEAALEHAAVEHGLHLDALPRTPPKLRRLVDEFREGQAMTRSDLENHFRRILKDAGLPMPLGNRAVWTGDRHYYPDFFWREHRLVVEIDGWTTHRARTEADRRREAHLSSLGLMVQRFTRLQLLRRPDEVVRALRPFLDARG